MAADRRALAPWLEDRGLDVVWSVGPGQGSLLDSPDPGATRPRVAGSLTLAIDAVTRAIEELDPFRPRKR